MTDPWMDEDPPKMSNTVTTEAGARREAMNKDQAAAADRDYLPSNTDIDAMHWVEAFQRRFPDCNTETGDLLAWFANMIMAGYDHAVSVDSFLRGRGTSAE